jgi:hypothetical protein
MHIILYALVSTQAGAWTNTFTYNIHWLVFFNFYVAPLIVLPFSIKIYRLNLDALKYGNSSLKEFYGE